MPRRSPVRRTLAAAALLCASAGAAAAQLPTSLTFFGDSFTDTGNGDIISLALLGVDLTPTPPYAPGRASDGPLYVDYLAAAFASPFGAVPSLVPGGRNYAVGTARTGVVGAGGAPVGMLAQLATYAPASTDPTGLYVLFGGANDVFDAALLGSPAQQGAALSAAVDNLTFLATTLYGFGARSFLVPNVPNVGLAPIALGSPGSPLLGALSAQFNTMLDARLSLLSAMLPGSTFYGLSLDTLFDNILFDVAHGGTRYGLTNATQPCLPGFGPPGAPPCAVSVFADQEHPTTAVHQLIANAAYQRVAFGVDVSAVPEPTTLVLVAGGLGLVAAAARRRRRVA